MPRVCPRPCGRLTTAAVFISIGVVQLLVGIILLRSKFADLLAGPDFMTASSNVGIGCVYGMAATVWKSKKKLNSTKETAKNNVLMSLLVSLIAVNATTVAVLILGEGSKLLTTYMETRHQESSTSLANEVLAGAYITSVCSPIVCIVVAIVALSGICFQNRGIKQQSHVKRVLNIGTSFDWNPKSRPSHDDIETPYTDSSPDTEDNVFSEKSHRKFKLSDRFFSSPPGRRVSNLARNSNTLKKRSPLFSSSLPKIERSDKELIPRIKKSSFLKKSSRLSQSDETLSYWDSVKVTRENDYSSRRDSKSEKEARSNSGVSRGTTRSQSTEDAFRKGSIDKTVHFFPNESRSSYTKNVSFEGVKGTPVYTKTFASPQIDDPGVSDIEEEPVNPPCMKLRIETLKELKTRIKSIPTLEPTEFLKNPQSIIKQEARSLGKAVSIPTVPRVDYERTDSFGNGDSETSEGSTKSTRNRPSQPDSFSTSHAEVCTPDALQQAKRVHATIMNGIRSKSLSTPPIESNRDDRNSSNSVDKEKKNLVLDNPQVPSIKQQNRKRDVIKRMASMESISEVSQEEFGNTEERAPGKRRFSSNKVRNGVQMITDENSNITDLEGSLRKSQAGTGKSKKQANPSIKNRLKGIWSSSSETKMDILELIMDQDSLIGLSEDELMSRTRRIRELRKTVAERLKSELKDSELSKSLNESSKS